MLVSNRALARALGLTEGSVRKAEKAGRITREPDGSWDVDRVRKSMRANTDPSKQGGGKAKGGRPTTKTRPRAPTRRRTDGGDPTYLQVKIASEMLRAEERRLSLDRLRGQLLSADEVARADEAIWSAIRDGVLALPDALADQLCEIAKAEGPVGVSGFLRERLEALLTDAASAEFELDDADQGEDIEANRERKAA